MALRMFTWMMLRTSMTLRECQSNIICFFQFQFPTPKGGSLRSAFLSDFKFVCLYLTEKLVPSLLQLIGGREEKREAVQKPARQIINFLTQFNEILVLAGADLDLLESAWSGNTLPNDQTEPEASEQFYVLMEASCYFDSSWNIVREISCIAVSKSAFRLLASYANFVARHSGIERLPMNERICPRDVLWNCIECLRSGSPWHVLLSTINSTLLSIYPLPELQRPDFTPAVEALGFGYVRSSRVRQFMERHELRAALSQGIGRKQSIEMKTRMQKEPPQSADLSFKRSSQQLISIMNKEQHDCARCSRCVQAGESETSPAGHGFLGQRILPEMSAYDMLVYVVNNDALALIVEDLVQSDFSHHTIQHDGLNYQNYCGYTWSLPLPYRPVAEAEHFYLNNWVHQLRGQPGLEKPKEKYNTEWEETQMLLYCLSIGVSYLASTTIITEFLTRKRPSLEHLHREIENKPAFTWGSPPTPRPILKLCGDVLARGYSSWEEGEKHIWEYLESLRTEKNASH
ncbi:hypothetical protein CISG_07471 [Coccidioides immitis RMSCC 3703]|uniref:Uncharacterized protein n=1 Tax=Coccidioides immitis RMSCC 3703 TaxID=454286 RepID=A0A0J8TWW6_COCIT|nr:hypothetical protein CISG_07471 [Coccidioides immitis RMSCC 3703]